MKSSYDFTPVHPPANGGAPVPLLLDLTGNQAAFTPADASAVSALAQVDATVGLWRAWRSARPGEAAQPVYLLETRASRTRLPGITAVLRNALTAAGVEEPLVEAYPSGSEPTDYQRRVRGRAALLWAAAPAVPMIVARVFDSFDPVSGGRFDTDHPRLTDPAEVNRVLRYLDSGLPILSTTLREPDVIAAGRPAVVPSSFRTDGRFVWTDAVGHYLRVHGLSPDPELLEHIRERDHVCAVPDPVTTHRILARLTA